MVDPHKLPGVLSRLGFQFLPVYPTSKSPPIYVPSTCVIKGIQRVIKMDHLVFACGSGVYQVYAGAVSVGVHKKLIITNTGKSMNRV